MVDRRRFIAARVIRIRFEASGNNAFPVIASYDGRDGFRNVVKAGLELVWFDNDAKAGNLRRGETVPPLHILVHHIDDRHREIPSDHALLPVDFGPETHPTRQKYVNDQRDNKCEFATEKLNSSQNDPRVWLILAQDGHAQQAQQVVGRYSAMLSIGKIPSARRPDLTMSEEGGHPVTIQSETLPGASHHCF